MKLVKKVYTAPKSINNGELNFVAKSEHGKVNIYRLIPKKEMHYYIGCNLKTNTKGAGLLFLTNVKSFRAANNFIHNKWAYVKKVNKLIKRNI
ncbi:MAG: hypothetical protein PHX70_07890 [Clostridium sp.]|nr:hypothetical protein [Clostridium sp.]